MVRVMHSPAFERCTLAHTLAHTCERDATRFGRTLTDTHRKESPLSKGFLATSADVGRHHQTQIGRINAPPHTGGTLAIICGRIYGRVSALPSKGASLARDWV